MPLLELWSSNPAAIGQVTIEQIVATAGSGELRDESACSQELRRYLTEVPSWKLAEYVDRCLASHFAKGGMVLQDLINELGRRLDYNVTNGRYQGTVNAVGYDGIWVSPEGHTIIAEVKTTDAYRISLDTIAGYREKLVIASRVPSQSSVLMVVGRQDTGELEAQVRGSRHAWDMRLISADSLIKLVQLKEDSEGTDTGRKMRTLLASREFTRLDQLVDVMFTTAKDFEGAAEAEVLKDDEVAVPANTAEKPKGVWEFTDSALLQGKRDDLVAALAARQNTVFIKKSRALYWSPNHVDRAAFTVSKRYGRPGGPQYWYAYHPSWDEFMSEADRGFFVLGCMDRDHAFAVPKDIFHPLIADLNTTEKEDGSRYWHIHLNEASTGEISLILPKRRTTLSLMKYVLPLLRETERLGRVS
jgi:hypothetical protein